MLHKKCRQTKTILTHCLISSILIGLCCGCTTDVDSSNKETRKKESKKTQQTDSYVSVTIPFKNDAHTTLLYQPADNMLSQIRQNGNCYTLSTWDSKKGWTTGVDEWKTEKHTTLDHFSYNTNGSLYACRKEKKKGRLVKQALVRLHKNGKIRNVRLIDLNHLSSGDSRKKIPEITDIQCCGTSVAITYQYGAVKIYNLAEGQALGASTITGTPGKNAFYDLHYLSLTTQNSSHSILLRDYDIRSGETSRTFSLGGAGQSIDNFYLSNYQNNLYVLTHRGLFGGKCSDSSLTKLLSLHDLKIPSESRIVYFQAGRDSSLYLGCKTGKTFRLRLITTPDPAEESMKSQTSETPLPLQI